jgi:hypothetical protein
LDKEAKTRDKEYRIDIEKMRRTDMDRRAGHRALK